MFIGADLTIGLTTTVTLVVIHVAAPPTLVRTSYTPGSPWTDPAGKKWAWMNDCWHPVEAQSKELRSLSVRRPPAGYMVPVPAGPAAQGDEQMMHITSVSGGRLTLDPSILVSDDSDFTGTRAMTAGKLYIVKLQRGLSGWMLVALVGGY